MSRLNLYPRVCLSLICILVSCNKDVNIRSTIVVFVAWIVCMQFELPLEHWRTMMIRVVRRRPPGRCVRNLSCRPLESSPFAPKTSLSSANKMLNSQAGQYVLFYGLLFHRHGCHKACTCDKGIKENNFLKPRIVYSVRGSGTKESKENK
jgi:hypothetical protein